MLILAAVAGILMVPAIWKRPVIGLYVLVGAAVMITLQSLFSFYTERWASILGLMFILTMLFAPEGLVGKGGLLWQRLLKRTK